MRKFISLTITAAFQLLLLAGCAAAEEMGAEDTGPTPIMYDCLYNCLWTVTDSGDGSVEIPSLFAEEGAAIYFYEKSGLVCLFRRRPDLEEETGRDQVYTVAAEGSYTIDYETRTVTISADGTEGYFHVERLNDRTLTLYYLADPDAYVAYTSSRLSSITVVK